MLASAALCWAVALMLQPLRGRLDTEPSPRHPIRLSDLRTTITAVLAVRELRSLSFACFAFNGTQAVFVAYFVTYMTAQGHPLVVAGSLYSTVIAVALPGRILWAWVGGFYVAPHVVLGGLAFGMAVSIALFGAVTPHWPLLAIGAVAMVVSATAMSWHGITLSEAARLAPPGRVGAVTGGVLSFGQIGALASPAVFSLLLRLTGGYSASWMACAVPAYSSASTCCARVSLRSSLMRCDLRSAVVAASSAGTSAMQQVCAVIFSAQAYACHSLVDPPRICSQRAVIPPSTNSRAPVAEHSPGSPTIGLLQCGLQNCSHGRCTISPPALRQTVIGCCPFH